MKIQIHKTLHINTTICIMIDLWTDIKLTMRYWIQVKNRKKITWITQNRTGMMKFRQNKKKLDEKNRMTPHLNKASDINTRLDVKTTVHINTEH